MVSEKLIRLALRISVPFNFLAAYAVAVPTSFMGRLMGLSDHSDVLNASLLSFLIASFGVVYGWLSLQKKIDRPLVCFSGVVKTGVFIIAFLVWVQGNASGMTVLFTVGDLMFAAVFFGWLLSTKAKN